MKNGRRMIAVLVLAVLIISITGRAEMSAVVYNKADYYEEGQRFLKFGMYKEAYDAFVNAKGYEDSGKWKLYCLGMICLNNADEWEEKLYLAPEADDEINKAGEYFLLLSDFEDASSLYQYCKARSFEYNGLTQSALNSYAELAGVYDSAERYLRLKKGEVLRNIPHESERIYPTVDYIEAEAYKKTPVYAGPGSNYQEETIVTVQEGTDFYIVGQEYIDQDNRWYLLEVKTEEGKKLRVWAQAIRIKRLENSEPVTYEKEIEKITLTRETEVFYGPGEDYMSRGIVLAPGTELNCYFKENGFYLVEIPSSNGELPVRGWISVDP